MRSSVDSYIGLKQLIQDLGTARQQNVNVPTLRYAAPIRGIIRQLIPLDHRDGPEEVCEHPRGESPPMLAPGTTARSPSTGMVKPLTVG